MAAGAREQPFAFLQLEWNQGYVRPAEFVTPRNVDVTGNCFREDVFCRIPQSG